MMHQKVSVIEDNLGRITIIYKGNKLDYEIHKQQPKINKIISNKNLHSTSKCNTERFCSFKWCFKAETFSWSRI